MPGFIIMGGRESGRGEKNPKPFPAPYKVDLTLIPRLDSEHLKPRWPPVPQKRPISDDLMDK